MVNDIFGKTFQLKFVRPADMLLFANAVCDPPLGQATVIPPGLQHVRFTILVESSKSFPEQPWEVVLWHGRSEPEEWQALALKEVSSPFVPLSVTSSTRSKVFRRYFSIDFARPADISRPTRFTFKYRLTASDSWKWANKVLNSSDGELYFQTEKPPAELKDYLKDYDSDIAVHAVPSESPGAQLWSIVAPIKGAEGKTSIYTKTKLGIPRSYSRWFAIVRTWTPWLAPRHGKSPFSPQQGAIICSFLRWDGLHLVLLAISGIEDVLTEFNYDEEGNVIASSRNDREGEGKAHIIAAVATTFESANAAVMYHARKIVAGNDIVSSSRRVEYEKVLSNEVKPEWMENWYDGLTYCTWNALGQDLTEEKILNALDELKKQDITITNLIIDDNWQSLHQNGVTQFDMGWSDFEANPQGFPNGLKHTAMTIRKNHPNIKHIAVWHAILGYWGAVSPDGKIARDYKTSAIDKMGGGQFTVVDEPDVDRMYNDFYQFLSDSGVDSVKTDAQFMLDNIANAPDRCRLMTAYQDAWTIAALRHFSIRAISCMSQFPQCLFHTQLPTNKPRFMVRNSDDFFPDIPASHPFHIFTNAHNTLFTSHLNIMPDWDMFQTHHEYSAFHAAGRCVSGGPIYITDEPEKHDLDLIAQMTAKDTEGKTIVLRPSVFGKSVNVYTAYEEERLLQVGTFAGGKGGTSILAVFNVSGRSLAELVNLSSFPGVEQGVEYVVRAHTTGEISEPISLSSKLPVISLEIAVKGYEILSAFPTHELSLGEKSEVSKVANLGLLGKMTGAAAVLGYKISVDAVGRLNINIDLKARGILGIYISDMENRTVEGNFLVLIQQKVIAQNCVKISEREKVLEVDVEKAWNEMGFKSGYSNEVSVEVLVS